MLLFSSFLRKTIDQLFHYSSNIELNIILYEESSAFHTVAHTIHSMSTLHAFKIPLHFHTITITVDSCSFEPCYIHLNILAAYFKNW